jgi:hypothetical protein
VTRRPHGYAGATLVVGMLVLGWPTTAQAADYAGGTAPETTRHVTRQLTLVGIRTADDGSARVSVKVTTPCFPAMGERAVQLAPDGTFALDFRVRGRVRDLNSRFRQRTRIRMSGQISGSAGTGTVLVNAKLLRSGRTVQRCNPGARTWQVRAAVAEPTGGAPVANGSYHGLTSQSARRPLAFVLRVDPRGRRVRTASFEYRQRCPGGRFEWENITPGGRVAADGTFKLRETFTYRWSDGAERYRVKVDGRFTPSGVNGTLSVTSVFRPKSGRGPSRCATGRQTFAALL